MALTLIRLRRLRELAALTQEELAARARVGRSTVSRLEAGRPAQMRTARRLAKALRCKPSLLAGDGVGAK
jgi:transcriptional regulator with XRE-family HTH domain